MEKIYKPTDQLTLQGNEMEYARTLENNNMNPLRAVLVSLLHLGVEGLSDSKEKKYIKSANVIFILTSVITIVYLTMAIFWDSLLWTTLLAFAEVISFSALILNAYGQINTSRYVFVVGVNLIIFLSSLMVGPFAHIHNSLMLSAILPFLIFNTRKSFQLAVSVAFPLVLMLVYTRMLPYFSAYHLAESVQIKIDSAGIFVQTVALLVMVMQLASNIRDKEDELELSHAQMQMQTSELRRSNSDLEQFAYIISHDLKAPVRNISSFMSLLLNKYGSTLNNEAKEFVNYSYSGSKRLERLIDDVLAYCRIGTNLPQPVPVNLNDVVKTIEFELRERLYDANATININKELPVVSHVHASLMYHIFQNLISNGLKFNKKEHPEITINWTNSLNHYTFSVQDNGIGISKEYSTTIFQMFKRLHNEQDYDGTGIGLAICKKIVEYYHGEIWFESKDGEGTIFHFTIRKF